MKPPIRAVLLAALTLAATLAGLDTATAHPLGNFSINQYHDLQLQPGQLTDHAVLDLAEIPTLQAEPEVDTNHDGHGRSAALAAYATRTCGRLAHAIHADADGTPLDWTPGPATMQYRPGAAGLNTSRFTCELTAPVHLRANSRITFRTTYLTDRVGWREITAHSSGPAMTANVPAKSTSDQLRSYPQDLLGDPLDIREAALQLGTTASSVVALASGPSMLTRAERLTAGWDRHLTAMTAAKHLTVPLGLAALALAIVLGAAHAALPGHGKTIMAAAMAGRRGGIRDATVVGATVTLTHTGGVLVTGLLLTTATALAGDQLLTWLALTSGLLVTATGAVLLRSALHRHAGSPAGGNHGHGDDHQHEHPDHHHPHGHKHRHPTLGGRGALVGMGVAGGLVPSPSALVVLLGAVALGHTPFGITLVIAYGAGMAATLTAAGLLITKIGQHPPTWLRDRIPHLKLIRYWTPAATACLVIVVGFGLTLRTAAGGHW